MLWCELRAELGMDGLQQLWRRRRRRSSSYGGGNGYSDDSDGLQGVILIKINSVSDDLILDTFHWLDISSKGKYLYDDI